MCDIIYNYINKLIAFSKRHDILYSIICLIIVTVSYFFPINIYVATFIILLISFPYFNEPKKLSFGKYKKMDEQCDTIYMFTGIIVGAVLCIIALNGNVF